MISIALKPFIYILNSATWSSWPTSLKLIIYTRIRPLHSSTKTDTSFHLHRLASVRTKQLPHQTLVTSLQPCWFSQPWASSSLRERSEPTSASQLGSAQVSSAVVGVVELRCCAVVPSFSPVRSGEVCVGRKLSLIGLVMLLDDIYIGTASLEIGLGGT